MKNKIVFGNWEAIAFTVNLIFTQIFLSFPRSMAEAAGTAGWILTIYVSVLAVVLFAVIAKLYSRFPGKDLMDIGQDIGGNIGRITVGFILLMHLIYINSVVLREFGEDIKIISLNVSPISFIILFFVVCMVVGAYAGLESLVRFHGITMPIFATGFILIILSVSTYFDFSNIQPLLGNGVGQVFGVGSFKLSIFSGVLVLILIIPYIKTNRNFKIVGFTSIGLAAFFLTVAALAYILVFPYPTATESFLPVYELARLINFGRFFQRVESIFVLLWSASGLIYLSTVFFLIVHIFKKTFKLAYYKPIIIPFAILIFNLSLLPSNLISAMNLETKYFRNYAWIVAFGMTILLLLIINIKKRKAKKGETYIEK